MSDLGSTQPPNPIIHEPSATIFNSTMLVTGALLLVAAYFLHRSTGRRVLTIPLAVFGFGVFGVGVFPGNVVPWHGLFALLTFFSGASPSFSPLGSSRARSIISACCSA
ncbi:DUF998 domain-containing protein [Haladaptatus sp. W1]|uniref:DUF998 domain-containing protein n=1 Tax=Haladaptatus sp. W1 TaxID=1897478 RepID=UPI0020C7D01D|nr:DUF998 domain-containing protein [Haladaptatus sp. W1]